MGNTNEKIQSTSSYKLIYVFRINDDNHRGYLKIGDASIKTSKRYTEFLPNSDELNNAARERIDKYTATAGIEYELLHTEIAVYSNDGKIKAFRDHNVHKVLKRSGIKRKYFKTNKGQMEWFDTDLNTAKEAIKAVKENKSALDSSQITRGQDPIELRPEQKEALKKTISHFKTSNKMLWNAKMRFGKTLTALQVVKEMGFQKTIIVTHRPVVSDGWYEDFKKIFYDQKDKYAFGSKSTGKTIDELLISNTNFVYFASIQDLRESESIGGNFEKNDAIFKTKWDFVIVDEAHEGTKTDLGKKVLKSIITDDAEHKTYVLELSGTPFNLLSDFDVESIYTWDYIMEQEAKEKWDIEHFGDSNPYEELPRMNIFTYHLEKNLPVYIDVEDKAFNFREFFRIWTGDLVKDLAPLPSSAQIGDFVHNQDILSFLDLICKEDNTTNYPFATEEYRDYFRHSLWVVPGVNEANALYKLLKEHHIFQHFEIINVAGPGNEEIDITHALDAVKEKMTDHPELTRTITITCGRLTTGVSVPEWTCVLMLAGSYETSASQYLQTIFRVQTPANIDGKIKDNCYVFDFAPDRTLKMVADSVQLSAKAGSRNIGAEIALDKFLNFCPVISIDGSNMTTYKVADLLQELKKAYVERVVKNGFDDFKIYNDELLHLTDVELDAFANLKKIVGESKQQKSIKNIEINTEGFTKEEREEIEKLEKKQKRELTEEEKARLLELKEKKKNRASAISILRAISIRMPLLVYGMNIDINTDITIDNFADNIDEASWIEFMPKGVSKELFKNFTKYYDKDIFIAASRRIRYIAKSADELEPTYRIKKITSLFATFKNPDKETVLTPWNVVNLHLSETIGGYDFFKGQHQPDEYLRDEEDPKYMDHPLISGDIFKSDSRILEINSKTGLYPLYIAYSLYRSRLEKSNLRDITFEAKQKLWDDVVDKQIYVICKTPMAKLITQRTLLGYRNKRSNMHSFDDLVMQMKDKPNQLIKKLTNEGFWNKKGNTIMKFNAVVGNPPYQGNNHSQIYPFFYLSAKKLGDVVSLIFPIGWQEPKTANGLHIMNTKEVKEDPQIVFIDNRQNVFPGVSGVEWANIVLWKKDYDNGLGGAQQILVNGIFSEEKILPCESNLESLKPAEIIELGQIIQKISSFKSVATITSSRKPYGLSTDVAKALEKNGLFGSRQTESDITIYASKKLVYAPIDYKFPKLKNNLNSYKVFIPYAWGNMDENCGLGGAFADVIIGSPNEACTETYLEAGPFISKDEAKYYAKYIMTKFARALLYLNKKSQHSTTSWGAIPQQTFAEEWWSKSIEEIDKKLFEKYNVPNNIIKFVTNNFQNKTVSDIQNFE